MSSFMFSCMSSFSLMCIVHVPVIGSQWELVVSLICPLVLKYYLPSSPMFYHVPSIVFSCSLTCMCMQVAASESLLLLSGVGEGGEETGMQVEHYTRIRGGVGGCSDGIVENELNICVVLKKNCCKLWSCNTRGLQKGAEQKGW